MWGRLHVLECRLRFRAATEPPLDVAVDREHRQAIPPEVDHEVHEVEPLGAVRFSVEFLRR